MIKIKNKENITLRENKKFEKGCAKPSEHILFLKIFPPPSHGGLHYSAMTFEVFVPVS